MRFFLPLFFLATNCLAFTVVIDPGHGGIDGGAVRGSFIESHIVFQIAERTVEQLKEKQDINVFLTRPQNRGKSLADRVDFASDKKADLFVSLHANSSNSSQVRGLEFYFNSKQGRVLLKQKPLIATEASEKNRIVETIKKDLVEFGKTKKSMEFSQSIQNAWMTNQDRKPAADDTSASKIRRAPFYVIENTSMPSVLMEVGFISNQREARKLVSATYQEELARALTEAIVKFKEMSDN